MKFIYSNWKCIVLLGVLALGIGSFSAPAELQGSSKMAMRTAQKQLKDAGRYKGSVDVTGQLDQVALSASGCPSKQL